MTEPHDGSFSQAKTANEVIKVEKSKHQLAALQNTVIEKQASYDHIVQLLQADQLDWQAWPHLELVTIAERLGVEPNQLQTLLMPSIDDHGKELGEITVRLD